MSNSPWEVRPLYRQIQTEIAAIPALHGGALIVDESADARAGEASAGAGRQYNGRLGKVDLCQVGVFLTYVQGDIWTWVDAELFLPQKWFTPEYALRRAQVGIPPERTFCTKLELAKEMIARAQENGLPFQFVASDELYGRSDDFRSWLDQRGIIYWVDIPCNTQVYLILPPTEPVEVRVVARDPQTSWPALRVRPTEGGDLVAPYAARRVWTMRDGCPTEEWPVMRREENGDIRYALSNTSAEPPLSGLAWMEAMRYFGERANQDAKSELGWDEFRGQKFRAWEHQAALTVLASWFIARVRLEWAEQYPRDPHLAQELELEVLPELSVANVRALLRAVMPLRTLTIEEARRLGVTHLLRRARSRRRWLQSSSRHNKDPLVKCTF